MAPLKNPRHEAFVRHLLEGKDATSAYELAGYEPDSSGANAARLSRNAKVQARVAELQSEVAATTVVTIEGLINEMEEPRKKATDLKQLSAAIKAIEGKAKLSGLMVERQQVEVGGPGSFDNLTDPWRWLTVVSNIASSITTISAMTTANALPRSISNA
jgi:phage terminase small subunit